MFKKLLALFSKPQNNTVVVPIENAVPEKPEFILSVLMLLA